MKSPRTESSSSSVGVSSDKGRRATWIMFSTFLGGTSRALASSSTLRFAPQALSQLVLDAQQFVDLVAHMDRHADRPALIGDGAGDRLADPPGRISAELMAAAIIEFLRGADQSDVAFLDQIQEGNAASHIFFGDAEMTSRELAVIKCSRAAQPSSISLRSSMRRRAVTLPLASSSRAIRPRSMRWASSTSSVGGQKRNAADLFQV